MPRREYLFIIPLALACLIAFSNAFFGQFLYDDQPYVTKNPQVNGEESLTAIFKQSTPPDKSYLGLYRPFFVVTLRWNHGLSGYKPSAFHATNLFIHFLAAGALFLLARHISRDGPAAFLGALLFAVHPAHVEAVAWIVGRAELLSCLFCLLAALLHFKAKEKPYLRFAEASAFILAALSKENALAFPLVLWILEAAAIRGRECFRIKQLIKGYWLYIAVILGLLVVRYSILGRLSPAVETAPFRHASLLERGEAALSCQAEYLRLFVFPYPLKIFYHRTELQDLTLLRVGILVLFGVLIFLAVKGKKPVLGWLLWIPAALLPVLNLVPIGAVFAERFFYLPSAGACVAAGIVLVAWIRKEHHARGTHLCVWIPTLIVLGLTILTLARNPAFDSSHNLWKDAVRKGGQFAFPHYNLGECYFEERVFEYQSPEKQGAVRELRESLALNPEHPYAFAAHYRLGQYYLMKYREYQKQGRREAGLLERAAIHLETSLRMSPPLPESLRKTAWILAELALEEDGMKFISREKALEYLALAEENGLADNKVRLLREELESRER
ncbi:MAG: tetratricopeptide repeat protein [Planctomycetota bacterium]|jgi:hypothetical protein